MDEEKEKNKQKPGLNAVRPDDFTKEQFKELAKENDISQTEMFKRIFYRYLRDTREEKQQEALSLEGEINNIAINLNNTLSEFKKIAEKAQNTVISTKSNAEQTIKNLTLNVDTLNKKIIELDKRNQELELSNSTYTEVKSNLENNITELKKLIENINKEKEHLKTELTTKGKKISDLEDNYKRTVDSYLSENKALAGTVNNLKNELDTYHNKIRNLEISNSSLEDTMKNIQNLKKSEIDAIVEKYKLQLQDLEIKLRNSMENKDKEISTARKNIETEMMAVRKEEVANLKLELAEFKSKYSEILLDLNSLKQNTK